MSKRDDVLASARTFFGTPYALPPDGVTTLDCSLFVLKAFEGAGIPIAGVRTAEQIRRACTPIDWGDVQPGDLLFFERTYDAGEPPGPDGRLATHIGISLGAGTKRMYDANDAHGTGETNLATSYWQTHIFEARRPPGLLADEATPDPQALPRGIDVASYQGNPDWAAVKASGVAFAFSKVTEDTGYTNPTFRRNWSEMKRVGIIRGAYHFARPEVNDAKGEADYFLDQIGAAGGIATGDLLALDLEAGSGDLGPWTLDFLRRCEARAGFKPLIYTGAWFSGPHNLAAYPEIGQYPLWLAAYQETMPPPPPPWSEVVIWQHSDKGQVPGIGGDVDLNVFNGDVSRLAFYGKPGAVTTAPKPTPYVVGDGVLALMGAYGDEPASNEMYPNQFWSETMGASGACYRWLKATGQTFRYPPAAWPQAAWPTCAPSWPASTAPRP